MLVVLPVLGVFFGKNLLVCWHPQTMVAQRIDNAGDGLVSFDVVLSRVSVEVKEDVLQNALAGCIGVRLGT